MSLWPLAVVLVFGVFVALSIDRNLTLIDTPPADFQATRVRDRAQPDLAVKYWQVAVHAIQWQYNRGSALPERPPADFAVLSGNETARQAYWAKLRQEWEHPESWHTTFTLDLQWPQRSARTFARQVMDFIDHNITL